MEELEMLCFEIISSVGAARSNYIEAIQAVKVGETVKADELMIEGRSLFLRGHAKHKELIQKEAAGNGVPINLILMHAEDQMMSAEILEIMAKEFIELYKSLKK